MKRRLSVALLVCASLVPSLGAAQAQPTDADIATARKLTLDGYAALEHRDYAQAESRFSRADTLFHAPTVALGLARARAGLGKLVGAQEAYSRVVHTTVPADASPAFLKSVEDARKELDALAPRVPSVILVVKGSNAPRVTLDGIEVPGAALGEQRPVDPGKHVVRATAPGFAASEATVTLAEGKTETVTLELKPGASGPLEVSGPLVTAPGGDAATSGAPPRRSIGIAALSVGAASLVAGVATGAIGLSKQSDLLKHCPGGACPSNSTSTYGSEVKGAPLLSTMARIVSGLKPTSRSALRTKLLFGGGGRCPSSQATSIALSAAEIPLFGSLLTSTS